MTFLNVALESLGVQAQESLYVDDYDLEADGARNLGFTSFHIVRSSKKTGEWAISTLREIVEYIGPHRLNGLSFKLYEPDLESIYYAVQLQKLYYNTF